MPRLRHLVILLLMVASTACGAGNSTPPPTPTGGAAGRSVRLTGLANIVDVRNSSEEPFVGAEAGQTVPVQGEVRTGAQSRAWLEFSDGASVGLAPSTSVGLLQLAGTSSAPLTALAFGAGTLWLSLHGGQFDIQTPIGLAGLRGTFATVKYDLGTDRSNHQGDTLTIECIAGTCSYSASADPIVIGSLQELIITNAGRTVSGPLPLPSQAIADFLASSPQSTAVALTMTAVAPRPTATGSATATPPGTPLIVVTGTLLPTSTPLPLDTEPATTSTPGNTSAPTTVYVPPTATAPYATAVPTNVPPPTNTPVPSSTQAPTSTPRPTATDTPKPPPPTATHSPAPSPTPLPTIPPTAPPTDTSPPPTATLRPTRTPPPTKTPSPKP
jgi:hypothetical protein